MPQNTLRESGITGGRRNVIDRFLGQRQMTISARLGEDLDIYKDSSDKKGKGDTWGFLAAMATRQPTGFQPCHGQKLAGHPFDAFPLSLCFLDSAPSQAYVPGIIYVGRVTNLYDIFERTE